jgi:universal stress protein F
MKKILVGLDGSPRSPHVLDTAVDLAQLTGATVYLYRAVGLPSELPVIALSMSPGDTSALLQRLAKEQLNDLEHSVPNALRGGASASLAIPWQGICEAARRVGADLIVIGSHGYGGLDRLLGTTAAKVVNHAPVSVLVVKEAAVADQDREG